MDGVKTQAAVQDMISIQSVSAAVAQCEANYLTQKERQTLSE